MEKPLVGSALQVRLGLQEVRRRAGDRSGREQREAESSGSSVSVSPGI